MLIAIMTIMKVIFNIWNQFGIVCYAYISFFFIFGYCPLVVLALMKCEMRRALNIKSIVHHKYFTNSVKKSTLK